MWVYDIETLRFLAVNDAAILHYGYSRDEFHSMTIRDIRPPEDVPALLENIARVTEGIDLAGVWRHRKKDGSLIDVSIVSHVLHFEGRKGELVMSTDVTGKLRLEASLRESEERFRSLAELLPQSVFETDASGVYTYMNRKAIEESGYSPEDIGRGIDVFLAITPNDHENVRLALGKVLAGEEIAGLELTVRRKDGSRLPVTVYASPIRREGRIAGVRGIAVDDSARKRAEEALRQAQKYEAVGLLAGGIAHNLNNLMTVVDGYSTLVLERMAPRDPWRREVEAIHRAGKRAVDLTAKLLGYGRRQMVRPEDVDLSVFLAELEGEIRRRAGPATDVSFLPVLSALVVRVDPERFRNVILHLVDNAREAMPGGGAIIVRAVEADLSREQRCPDPTGRYAMLSLTDTGVGMDPETSAQIFDPFFTTKGLGVHEGLSLPAAYGFIKQSNGYIFVDSTAPGQGTTISIYLPVAGSPRKEPASS